MHRTTVARIALVALLLAVPAAWSVQDVEADDPTPRVREQVRKRLESILSRADKDTLKMLAPLLALLDDGLARKR